MTKELCALRPGEAARVARLEIAPGMRRRLLDLGFTEGTKVRCLFDAPGGDPQAYWVRGAIIALRREDATRIVAGLADAPQV